jgi:hypothetical protein
LEVAATAANKGRGCKIKHIKVISGPKKAQTGIPTIDSLLCVTHNGDGFPDPDCTTPLKCAKGLLNC